MKEKTKAKLVRRLGATSHNGVGIIILLPVWLLLVATTLSSFSVFCVEIAG
jgi:hypothetical protein